MPTISVLHLTKVQEACQMFEIMSQRADGR